MRNFFLQLYIRFRGRPGALKKATKEAIKLHKETGKRYRVFFFGYKYRVWTRSDIKERKNIGLFKHYLKAGKDFDGIAFFDTNSLYNIVKGANYVHSS